MYPWTISVPLSRLRLGKFGVGGMGQGNLKIRFMREIKSKESVQLDLPQLVSSVSVMWTGSGRAIKEEFVGRRDNAEEKKVGSVPRRSPEGSGGTFSALWLPLWHSVGVRFNRRLSSARSRNWG